MKICPDEVGRKWVVSVGASEAGSSQNTQQWMASATHIYKWQMTKMYGSNRRGMYFGL